MASARQCDRCKQFYKENTKHPSEGSVLRGILGGVATIDPHGNYDTCFDLCDDCLTDFKKFMKGAKV